jgi:hypothetical protein
VSGVAVDPRTFQPDRTARRPLQTDDDLQERALAGPVGTDDGDYLAVVDPEGDAVDRRQATEALRECMNLEEQALLRPTTAAGTGSGVAT